ncbi:SagB/ThcOx family dehydrogenase [Streptomyces sp. NPDC052040]|uniref:SagB/ThcOx family dehydrogenase n=1 Tax=Streptomyces sp. NPDC052040 TaxID=3365682 RepID=UPI0037D4729A
MKVKAISPLLLQCDRGKIYLTSPRMPGRLRIKRQVAEILFALQEPQDQLTIGHPELSHEQTQSVIQTLISAGYILPADEAEQKTQTPHPWDVWGANAWNFHTQLKDAPFLRGASQEMEAYEARITSRVRPPNVREEDPETPVLLLPRVRSEMNVPFRSVLENRRTHRHFKEDRVGLDDFATLLHYSFAPMRFADSGVMGVQQLKSYASGGARHEAEFYIAVFNVHGVEAGTYRYDTIRHGLVPVEADLSRAAMERFTYDQGFFTTSSFGVVTTALTERMAWKYPHPRAYKLMLHNVGHLVQVFSMTASALGLGAAITGGFRDTEVENALRLEGSSEFPTFFMSCGVPELTPEGQPAVYRAPTRPTLS